MSLPLPPIINKEKDVKELVTRIRNEGDTYTYDFETLGTQVAKLKVAGIGLAFGKEKGQGSYIVCEHKAFPTFSWQRTLEILQPLFEDSSMKMVAHNQLFDASILKYYGVDTHVNTFDTMVASWLLDTSTPNGLKYIVKTKYSYEMATLTEFAKKVSVNWHSSEKIFNLDEVPIDTLAEYAVDDVLWTYRLYQDYTKELAEQPNLEKVYKLVYPEVLETLSCMQVDGITLDLNYLAALREKYQNEVDELFWKMQELRPGRNFDPSLMIHTQNAIKQYGSKPIPQVVREQVIDLDRKLIPELNDMWKRKDADRPRLYEKPDMAYKLFNPGSTPQLGQVLYNELGLNPVGKKNKNDDYSTGKDAIAKLVDQDKSGIVEMFQRYNMLGTLTDTFLTKPQILVDKDNRIRTNFRTTLATGRLSSSGPNLQNIPARTKEGKDIRSAFVAKEGCKLVVVDFSSMEMRVVAHFSQDENLVRGFKNGDDPHSATAKVVFDLDCPVEDVKNKFPDERQIAKTINFALLYGAGAMKLSDSISQATEGRIRPSIKQSQVYKEDLLSKMPGVKDFIEESEKVAKNFGVAETIIGRLRHVPEATLQDGSKEYFGALRQAVNSKIQGSASDFIMLAMRNIRRDFIERGWWRTRAWMLLQVHDELVLEADEDIAEEVLRLTKHHMENAILGLDVPIVAAGDVASNWSAAK